MNTTRNSVGTIATNDDDILALQAAGTIGNVSISRQFRASTIGHRSTVIGFGIGLGIGPSRCLA